MDEVIVTLPLNFDLKIDHEELLAYWSGFASKPMMDDGRIGWYKKGKAKFVKKVLNRLEEDVEGLEFKRIKNPEVAEIVIQGTNYFQDNYFKLGEARWSPYDPRWILTIKRGFENRRSTIVHEIGHALGLGHPENHKKERDTIMSYYRDKSSRYFFPKDIDILTGIYF